MIFFFFFFRKKREQIEVFKSKKGLFEDSQFTRGQTKIKPKKKKVKLKSTWRIKFIIHRVYRAFHEFSLFS